MHYVNNLYLWRMMNMYTCNWRCSKRTTQRKWRCIKNGCMHKWVDQFGCHISQFYLVVAIAMPMLFYSSWNLLKWTWFKDLNLDIYIMHKINLQIKKNCKSHGLFNSKHMDYTSNYHFFVDYDMVHWSMGCVV
jgi:hypothetical protein